MPFFRLQLERFLHKRPEKLEPGIRVAASTGSLHGAATAAGGGVLELGQLPRRRCENLVAYLLAAINLFGGVFLYCGIKGREAIKHETISHRGAFIFDLF